MTDKKSNSYVVEYAMALVGKGGYWYGCYCQTATPELLAYKKSVYPARYNQDNYRVRFTDQFGLTVTDCAGLLKGALWSKDKNDYNVAYHSDTDFSANGWIEKGCSETGAISSIPEIPGLIVWKSGHLGIYIGNRKVCEARGHDYGIVITDLDKDNRGWQKWGKCKWINYETKPEPDPKGDTCMIELPVLRKGDKGEVVKTLQIMLNGLGYRDQNKNRLEVDGSFGSKTLWCVKDYQARNKLTIDGVVGKATWTSILK